MPLDYNKQRHNSRYILGKKFQFVHRLIHFAAFFKTFGMQNGDILFSRDVSEKLISKKAVSLRL